MLQRCAVVWLFFLFTGSLHAGEPLFVPHGAGQAGMAFACTASSGHWNSFHNQALMAGSRDVTAGIAFESRFMMAEMSSKAVSLVIPGGPAPVGIIATQFGNGQYSSIFAGVGSALIISDGLSFGLQADLIAETGIGDYRDVYHATFEAGLVARVSPALTLGVHLFNPVISGNTLPSSISAGVSWSPVPELMIGCDVSKMTDEPLSLNGGMSWQLLRKLVFRTGYMSSPSSFAFGAGYTAGPVQSDIAFVINNFTGVTSSVSFTWTINKR
jgi:hypothetical protein